MWKNTMSPTWKEHHVKNLKKKINRNTSRTQNTGHSLSNIELSADNLDHEYNRYDNEVHNDHDNHADSIDCYKDSDQRHMDALRNATRLVNGTVKSWLIMDNADNNVDIEMKRLSMISKDLNMIDTTSNMDMINKLFDHIVLVSPNSLTPPYQTI